MGGTTLRLATWNVNGLRARAARVATWLDAAAPDVVLLQETKCDPEQVPDELFTSRGYAWSARGGSGRNGVLIASRVGLDDLRDDLAPYAPTQSSTGEPLPDLLAEPRFLSAICGGVRVASIYAPNGREVGAPHWHAKLHWFATLRAWSSAALNEAAPLALGGDFNVAPRDVDVWDPSALIGATHVTSEERAAWLSLIDAGLIDAAQALATSDAPTAFTWWDYRGGAFHRGWGMRIDHILVEARAGKIVRSSVDRDGRKGESPSDHAALMIDVARPA